MSLVASLSPFNHLKIMRFKILLIISIALKKNTSGPYMLI